MRLLLSLFSAPGTAKTRSAVAPFALPTRDVRSAPTARTRGRYANEFNNLLSAYQAANDIDLTRDHDPPADNLYIRVNVLTDVGQFVGPESGVNLDLKRGDLSYLRRGDVEHLVRARARASACPRPRPRPRQTRA